MDQNAQIRLHAQETTPTDAAEDTDARVLSHLAIRQLVGVLGFALPTLLYVYARGGGGDRMQPSISEFYYTAMGDVMVGCLVAIGVFLLTYRGYQGRPCGLPFGDRGASVLGGLGAIGTAFFPTTGLPERALCFGDPIARCGAGVDLESGVVTGLRFMSPDVQNTLHFGSAGLFLIALAYMCIFLFPIGPRRNGQPGLARLFEGCGVVILLAILGLIIVKFQLSDGLSAALSEVNIVFWLETIAVFAFAFAWLVKGKPLRHPLGLRAPRPKV